MYNFFCANIPYFIKYLSVGATAAIVQLASFAIFWHVVALDYKISLTVSYILSVIFHFTANRCFTFQSQGSDLIRHVMKYLLMIIVNYLITMIVVHIAVSNLHLSPYVGILLSIATTLITGYLLIKLWIFQQVVIEK